MNIVNNSADQLISAKTDLAKLMELKNIGKSDSAAAQRLLTKLLDQRGVLNDKISDAMKTIKLIEDGIKELALKEGQYGERYTLKISPIKAKPLFDEEMVKKIIAEKNLNFLDFYVLNQKSPELEKLIQQHPEILKTNPSLNYRHYFK